MNNDIKDIIKQKGIKQWQVAEKIGISERTLIVWLRSELNDDRRQKIEKAINALATRG